MGIFSFCGQLPGAFATATTAFLFRSMKEAFVVSAVFGILVFVLWIMFVSDRPESTEAIEQEQQESVPLQEALQVVLKNKGVWMVAICIMMILGTNVTFSTFLPTTLQSMYGLDLTTCGTIASMLTLGNCIGSIAGNCSTVFCTGHALLEISKSDGTVSFDAAGRNFTWCGYAGVFFGTNLSGRDWSSLCRNGSWCDCNPATAGSCSDSDLCADTYSRG